jgi:hypothetical protein
MLSRHKNLGAEFDPALDYSLSFVKAKPGITMESWLTQWQETHGTETHNTDKAAREALMQLLMSPEGKAQLEKLFEEVASLGWNLMHRSSNRRAKWGDSAHILGDTPKELDGDNIDILHNNILIQEHPLELHFIDPNTEGIHPITKPRSDERRARGAEFAVQHFLNGLVHTFLTEGDMARLSNIRGETFTFHSETEKRFYDFLNDTRDHLPFWPSVVEMAKPVSSRAPIIKDHIPHSWREKSGIALVDTHAIQGIPMKAAPEELLQRLRKTDASIGR